MHARTHMHACTTCHQWLSRYLRFVISINLHLILLFPPPRRNNNNRFPFLPLAKICTQGGDTYTVQKKIPHGTSGNFNGYGDLGTWIPPRNSAASPSSVGQFATIVGCNDCSSTPGGSVASPAFVQTWLDQNGTLKLTGNTSATFSGSPAAFLEDGAWLSSPSQTIIRTQDENLLLAMYGTVADGTVIAGKKFYTTAFYSSADGGITWKYASRLDQTSAMPTGGEGPCEPGMVLLASGSVMAVLRMGGGLHLFQVYSHDNGASWTTPSAMRGCPGVRHDPIGVWPQPLLLSNGMLTMVSGRPGISLWTDSKGDGKCWSYGDVEVEHSAMCPSDPFTSSSGTTSYAAVAETEPGVLYVAYDKTGADREGDVQKIYSVRINVTRTRTATPADTAKPAARTLPPSAHGAARSAFSLAWKQALPDPYEPMALGIVAHADSVVLGLRDCPDNTENQLQFLALSSGKVVQSVGATNGTSEIAVAHRGKDVVVYGCGWVKTADPEFSYLAGSVGVGATYRAWSSVFRGEGSMWGTAAVSSTGDVGAVLLEPTPNEEHMNNRSAVLHLFGPASATPLYTYEVVGLGSTDPQTASISAHATAAGVYTVGAIMGYVTVVIDFDTSTNKGTVVYRKSFADGDQDEMVIAISPNGQQFAVSTDTNVDVFRRTAKGTFSKVAFEHIKPPTTDQTANAIVFAEEADVVTGETVLAVGWCGQQGESTGVSAHYATKAGQLKAGWAHHQLCGGNNFDSIGNNGLAVSSRGEYVVVGKWGCGSDSMQRLKNFAVFEGVGGKGVPAFEAKTPGQIWAVDVDVAANGTVVVGAAAWSLNSDGAAAGQNGSVGAPAEVYLWAAAKV